MMHDTAVDERSEHHAQKQHRRRSPVVEESNIEKRLLQVVDAGLAGIVFFVPLVMGGRQALGHFALVVLAVTVALAWCARQCLQPRARWTFAGVEWLLALGVLLVLAQLVPLPSSLLASISPHLAETLPLWNSGTGPGSLGHWSQLTLTPSITQQGLILYVAYALVFGVAVQRLQHRDDVERLLRWVSWSAALMATFGLVQYLTNNGKFFWAYEHPFTDTSSRIKGSFTNKNHFAHFLALGIGPLIWFTLQTMSQRQRDLATTFKTSDQASSAPNDMQTGLAMLGLGLVVFAALLSLSRGGAVALLAAAFVCVGLLYRAGQLSVKFVLGLGGIGLLVGALLFVHGQETVSKRLDDFFAADLETLDVDGGRRSIWTAVSKGIAAYPLLGTGLGSHAEVYPVYLSEAFDREFTHAENGYLQVALECGGLGLALVLVGFACCGFWCLAASRANADARSLACVAAISASLVASLVQSAMDFVWYVPGCTAIIAVLAACACRNWQLSRNREDADERGWQIPRGGWIVASAGLTILAGWMLQQTVVAVAAEPHWHQYLNLALDRDDNDEANKDDPQMMIAELQAALSLQPDNARAHLRLARLYLIEFNRIQATAENPMTLEQFRDAAAASQFESPAALNEWLLRAIGKNRKLLDVALRHTKRSLALCPLQGDAYVYLAKLGFLEGADPEITSAYLEQALKVRPHDGRVLYAVGKEVFLRGDLDRALGLWQRSFKCERDDQLRILDLLSGRVPAAFILEKFEPDAEMLGFLVEKYRAVNQPAELAVVLKRFAAASTLEAQTLEPGSKTAHTWMRIFNAYAELNDEKAALNCIRQALKADPNDFDARYALGLWSFNRSDFANAAKYLMWCADHRPDNKMLRKLADAAYRQNLTNGGGLHETATPEGTPGAPRRL
jgi:O-antigen ligase